MLVGNGSSIARESETLTNDVEYFHPGGGVGPLPRISDVHQFNVEVWSCGW